MSSVSFSDASAREEPPRRRVQRTLSTVERDALQSVLDVVERETDSEHTKGMSRFTFFLGLANLILSAFLLGACTESFWLVYAIQALFIIGLRIRHSWSISKGTPTQPGMLLYYLDLCWIANFLLAFSFMAVLVAASLYKKREKPVFSTASRRPAKPHNLMKQLYKVPGGARRRRRGAGASFAR